jgi:hypothetical protein
MITRFAIKAKRKGGTKEVLVWQREREHDGGVQLGGEVEKKERKIIIKNVANHKKGQRMLLRFMK